MCMCVCVCAALLVFVTTLIYEKTFHEVFCVISCWCLGHKTAFLASLVDLENVDMGLCQQPSVRKHQILAGIFKWLSCLMDSNNIHRKFCLVGVWGLDMYMKFLKASLSGYCHWHPPRLSNFPSSTFLFTSCQPARCYAASFVGSFFWFFFRSGLMASQDEPDPLLKWLFFV